MLDLIRLFKSVQGKKARTNSHILKAGFTLIELSIVLVIIGLLLGGIIVRQDLIHAAQIRSVIADIDKYKTVYNTFKGKYNCIPGDCINATDFFGAENLDFNTCAALTTPSTSNLTCNGNGNGQVDPGIHEMFRFWQQLANAGLIKGKYTGVTGAGSSYAHVLGVNSPLSAISSVGFGFSYYDLTLSTSSYEYAQNYGNRFMLGKQANGSNLVTGFLTPAKAYAFDQKIDDGLPATGSVIMLSINSAVAVPWQDPNACSTSTSYNATTGIYNTASNNIVCSFFIKIGGY